MTIETYLLSGRYEFHECIRTLSGELEFNTQISSGVTNIRGHIKDVGYITKQFDFIGALDFEDKIFLAISSNPLIVGQENIALLLEKKGENRLISGEYFGVRRNVEFYMKNKNTYDYKTKPNYKVTLLDIVYPASITLTRKYV